MHARAHASRPLTPLGMIQYVLWLAYLCIYIYIYIYMHIYIYICTLIDLG